MENFQDNFIKLLAEYVNKNPDDMEVYSILGTMLRETGYSLKAAKIHRNILAKPLLKKGFRIDVTVELAKDLLIYGNVEQARKLIESVIKSDSKSKKALRILFEIEKREGNLEKAVDAIEKVDGFDELEISSTYSDFAQALIEKGDTHKAKKALKRAISADSANIEAYILMGDAELKEENYKSAIENYFSAIDRDPAYTAVVLGKIENAFYQSNSFDDLSVRLREELSAKNDNADMHYALGRFLAKRRLPKEAKTQFKKAIEFNPTHIEAREELLNYLIEEKDAERIKSETKEFFSEIKKNTYYFCTKCGQREKVIRWKCPSCGTSNAFEKRILLF